jgi:hypothetical protein
MRRHEPPLDGQEPSSKTTARLGPADQSGSVKSSGLVVPSSLAVPSSLVAPSGPVAKAASGFWRTWSILRQVLRGYCSGQPADESRPRKGCC